MDNSAIQRINDENKQLFEEFLGILTDELKRAVEQNGNLCLLLIAPDYEQPFAPEQQAEKSCLEEVTEVFREQASMEGRFLNYGFERLAVIFFRLPVEEAVLQASKGQRAVGYLAERLGDASKLKPVSMGFSAYPENGILAEELASAAMNALDQAQKMGGNRLVTASEVNI